MWLINFLLIDLSLQVYRGQTLVCIVTIVLCVFKVCFRTNLHMLISVTQR